MRRICYSFLILGMAMLVTASVAQAGVEVGSPAPEFCLPSSAGDQVCLKDFRGKDNVVLLFYVLDFTPG
jgi:peroxiredoxin